MRANGERRNESARARKSAEGTVGPALNLAS